MALPWLSKKDRNSLRHLWKSDGTRSKVVLKAIEIYQDFVGASWHCDTIRQAGCIGLIVGKNARHASADPFTADFEKYVWAESGASD